MYVKLINNTIIEAPVNNEELGIINYNLNIPFLIRDGYKLLIEIEKPITNRKYHIEYQENEDSISEILIYDETQEEADFRESLEEKERKIDDINMRINQLNDLSLSYLRKNEQENVIIINSVIKGLEETRSNYI